MPRPVAARARARAAAPPRKKRKFGPKMAAAVSFDHVHIISADALTTAQWYVDVLGGEITSSNEDLRGAPQVAVRFTSMNLLIRGARPGEAPGSTAALQTFGPAEFEEQTRMGPFVSHNEWGTDHFAFRVHGDLEEFCDAIKAKGATLSVEPYLFVPPGPGKIAYLQAPDNVSIELVPGPPLAGANGEAALSFDHMHLISSDAHAAAQWYAEVLGGEIKSTQDNLRGAVQVSVGFEHQLNILIRDARPGETPASTAELQSFGPDTFDEQTRMGPFVSHNEWGTDHFAFRVHEDLEDFCDRIKAKGSAVLSVEPYVFVPPGRNKIAYLRAPDGVSIELVQGPLTKPAAAL